MLFRGVQDATRAFVGAKPAEPAAAELSKQCGISSVGQAAQSSIAEWPIDQPGSTGGLLQSTRAFSDPGGPSTECRLAGQQYAAPAD